MEGMKEWECLLCLNSGVGALEDHNTRHYGFTHTNVFRELSASAMFGKQAHTVPHRLHWGTPSNLEAHTTLRWFDYQG